jgi:hypothetical protein
MCLRQPILLERLDGRRRLTLAMGAGGGLTIRSSKDSYLFSGAKQQYNACVCQP